MADEAQDEMAPYFNRETTPKILITTTDRPSLVSFIHFSYHNMCRMHLLLICKVETSTDTVIIIKNFIHCDFIVALKATSDITGTGYGLFTYTGAGYRLGSLS